MDISENKCLWSISFSKLTFLTNRPWRIQKFKSFLEGNKQIQLSRSLWFSFLIWNIKLLDNCGLHYFKKTKCVEDPLGRFLLFGRVVVPLTHSCFYSQFYSDVISQLVGKQNNLSTKSNLLMYKSICTCMMWSFSRWQFLSGTAWLLFYWVLLLIIFNFDTSFFFISPFNYRLSIRTLIPYYIQSCFVKFSVFCWLLLTLLFYVVHTDTGRFSYPVPVFKFCKKKTSGTYIFYLIDSYFILVFIKTMFLFILVIL